MTRGAIKGRFFHFYPQRDVEILKWLGYWMKKGKKKKVTDINFYFLYESMHDKYTIRYSEDSDQPAHPCSLVSLR